jgi:hypothetical protein
MIFMMARSVATKNRRGKETGKRGATRQRSREARKQGSREAGKQGSREAGKQGSREAGKQGSRERMLLGIPTAVLDAKDTAATNDTITSRARRCELFLPPCLFASLPQPLSAEILIWLNVFLRLENRGLPLINTFR